VQSLRLKLARSRYTL